MCTREIIHVIIIEEKHNSDDVGLYRDDGLLVFRNIIWQIGEKQKNNYKKKIKKHKNIKNNFKDKGLQIIIKCNLKIVNYLEVTSNLNDGRYRPFQNLMVKQLTYMSNTTTLQKVSRKSQDQLEKDYLACLQQ